MQLTLRLPRPAVTGVKLYCWPWAADTAIARAAKARTHFFEMVFSFRAAILKASPSCWNEFNIYRSLRAGSRIGINSKRLRGKMKEGLQRNLNRKPEHPPENP